MNKNAILEYIKTIAITLVFTMICVVFTLLYIRHEIYTEEKLSRSAQKEYIDPSMIGLLIDKNIFLKNQYPKNYKYNFRLGILYEMKGQNDKAEQEYNDALEKVHFGEYRPYYRFALFYLKNNKLDEAQGVMDRIDDRYDKTMLKYKGEIYNKLGDKYYNLGEYENAGLKYKKALRYFEAIHSPQLQQVKNSLASAYVYLAEERIADMQVDDAISSLKLALDIVDAPILKYKLAILLMIKEPKTAYKYFEEVFKKEPGIINFETYSAFLGALMEEAQANGESALAKLYDYKIRKLKAYYRENVLSIQDVSSSLIDRTVKFNPWTQKYVITSVVKVKNTSKHNINNLYLEVVVRDKDIVVDDYYKKIADKNKVLRLNAETDEIKLRSDHPVSTEDAFPKIFNIEIYAVKSEDSYKILLHEFSAMELKKRKKVGPAQKTVFKILNKLGSMLPAWMY